MVVGNAILSKTSHVLVELGYVRLRTARREDLLGRLHEEVVAGGERTLFTRRIFFHFIFHLNLLFR